MHRYQKKIEEPILSCLISHWEHYGDPTGEQTLAEFLGVTQKEYDEWFDGKISDDEFLWKHVNI